MFKYLSTISALHASHVLLCPSAWSFQFKALRLQEANLTKGMLALSRVMSAHHDTRLQNPELSELPQLPLRSRIPRSLMSIINHLHKDLIFSDPYRTYVYTFLRLQTSRQINTLCSTNSRFRLSVEVSLMASSSSCNHPNCSNSIKLTRSPYLRRHDST